MLTVADLRQIIEGLDDDDIVRVISAYDQADDEEATQATDVTLEEGPDGEMVVLIIYAGDEVL